MLIVGHSGIHSVIRVLKDWIRSPHLHRISLRNTMEQKSLWTRPTQSKVYPVTTFLGPHQQIPGPL